MGTAPRTTRDNLIGIAQGVVARRGMNGTRLTDVAAIAGVSAPAMYSHFSSRIDMLEQVLETTSREYVDDLRVSDDPLQSVEVRFRVRFARWAALPDTRMRVLNHAIVAMHDSPRITVAVNTAQAAWTDFIRDVLSTGLRRGQLRPDLDLEAATDLLNATFFGVQAAVTSGLVDQDLLAMVNQLLDMFLYYVSTKTSENH
jgi:TetR/AcrR family transcriptional regulator, cholesterol catabolism regulator